MNYDDFIKTFKPVKNPKSDGCYDGCFFDVGGDDINYVRKAAAKNPKCIWTVVNAPGSKLQVLSGIWGFDRMGYFVASVPFTGEAGELGFEI